MERINGQRRRKDNVAQKYRDAQTHRTPVVEALSAEAVEEVHSHHHQAGDIEHIQH